MQTVPVAPNRFRPVNRVGDIVYEHPQNTLLAKIVNGNLDLLAASRAAGGGGGGAAGGAAGGVGGVGGVGGAAEAEQAALGRSLRVWLDMQNSINALFDTSTAENTHGVNVSPGGGPWVAVGGGFPLSSLSPQHLEAALSSPSSPS